MSAKEVLADMFEEVTGDPEKRWPLEWMAIQIAKARPALDETAISLAAEAGANEAVIDAALNPNLRTVPALPIWSMIRIDKDSRLFIDLTEQFEPELEIALRAEAEDFPEDDLDGAFIGPGVPVYHVYRIVLDPFEPRSHPMSDIGIRAPTPWPRNVTSSRFTPHWAKPNSLRDAARSVPTTSTRLRVALCSNNPWRRAWAYNIIAEHHGLDSFDDAPLLVSGRELRERWSYTGLYTALSRPAKGQPLRYGRGR